MNLQGKDYLRDEMLNYLGVKFKKAKDKFFASLWSVPHYIKFNGEIEHFPEYALYKMNILDEEDLDAIDWEFKGLQKYGVDAIKNNFIVDYELIGIGVHKGASIESGHWVAYIKDQFEDKPQKQVWYYCDDLGGIVKQVDKLLTWSMTERPEILLYKKIERPNETNMVAQAFENIIRG